MYDSFVRLVRDWYLTDEFVPLHEPRFNGNELTYVREAIESTFVSSVSDYVTRFENQITEFTGAEHAVAVANGTAALHLALYALGVEAGDEVITQPLTFVATCNAIKHCGADPVFVDIEPESLGMCAGSLSGFLQANTINKDSKLINGNTGKRISACLPMHTMGHAADIIEIRKVCDEWGIPVVEDAAEALGSYFDRQHCGTFGDIGTLSFNGNKIITTGAGGAVVTDDGELAPRLRHLATTAKLDHPWEFVHDEVGFNYRMPGLNAALGVAQFEMLPEFLRNKAELANHYRNWAEENDVIFVSGSEGRESNNWLNAFLLSDKEERNAFLGYTNEHGVMTRPAWTLMNDLEPYKNCQVYSDAVARDIQSRLVNVPSSARVA